MTLAEQLRMEAIKKKTIEIAHNLLTVNTDTTLIAEVTGHLLNKLKHKKK
jgi:hypothetical protein